MIYGADHSINRTYCFSSNLQFWCLWWQFDFDIWNHSLKSWLNNKPTFRNGNGVYKRIFSSLQKNLRGFHFARFLSTLAQNVIYHEKLLLANNLSKWAGFQTILFGIPINVRASSRRLEGIDTLVSPHSIRQSGIRLIWSVWKTWKLIYSYVHIPS